MLVVYLVMNFQLDL